MSTTLLATLFQDNGPACTVTIARTHLFVCLCSVGAAPCPNPRVFWGCSYLQSVIACNRQIRRERCGRFDHFQWCLVDTWGTVHNDETSWHQGLWSGTTPCVSTLCLPDVTACGEFSQTSPLCICILQAIKISCGNKSNHSLHVCQRW